MDYNYLSLLSMLPTGRYDVCRRRFERKRERIVLNYLCAAVCLFCGVKNVFIILIPRKYNSILYLGELYLHETPTNLDFQIGSTLIHFTIFYAFVYWAALSRDASRFECVRFLFIANLNDLCKCYDLDPQATKKFLRTADYIRYLVYGIMISFQVFIFVLICRCVVVAYLEIELNYFLVFTLPLIVITWFSYHCLIMSIPVLFIFLFTTQAFIYLRLSSVAQLIREFHKLKRFERKPHRLQITRIINDIVRQFNASNLLFDDLISPMYINCLICGLLYPNFFFESMPPFIFTIVAMMYIGGLTIPVVLAVFNETFVHRIKVLESSIHSAMPTHKDIRLKLALTNYLILNNEHKVISYNFFRSFDYSTMDLVEYLTHSLSLVFLIAPLVEIAKQDSKKKI